MVDLSSLSNAAIFAGLSQSEIRELESVARVEETAKGECLFSHGETADTLYLAKEGRFALTIEVRALDEHFEVPIEEKAAGEAFGWSSLIDRDVYSASAECRKDTILQKFDRRTLQKILEEDLTNGIIFYKRLAGTIGYRLLCSYKMSSSSSIADTSPTLGSGQIEHSEAAA
jgi:CRP/FNR family cyclic AMP-dependent transcriptional regulator